MNKDERERGAELIKQWREHYSHLAVIPDNDLLAAVEVLDQWVGQLRACNAAGGGPNAEQLCLQLLSDTDDHAATRHALLLALALQRLAAQ